MLREPQINLKLVYGDVITFSFSNKLDLENAKNFTDCEQEGNDLRITVQDGAGKIPSFANVLTANNIEIEAVSQANQLLMMYF